jgi:hypothetical protein
MEWIAAIIAIGVVIYFWQRSRAPKIPLPRPMDIASDRELLLATFRRELANYLIRLDPNRFQRFYQKARQIEIAIDRADKEERQAQLIIIAKRYPSYSDFDFVGTREHVLYGDALQGYTLEDIEEHYLNLVKSRLCSGLSIQLGIQRRATKTLSTSRSMLGRSKTLNFVSA